MKKILAITLLSALMLSACSLAPAGTTVPETTAVTAEPDGTTAPSMKAPDISFLDADGNKCKLSDFAGKPVVLNFWASWCNPCKAELPDFQKVYDEKKDDIHFLIVNLADGTSETVDSAKNFLQEEGYTFPAYFDTEGMAYSVYGVSSIPTTFFISADGNAVAYASGRLDEETLMQGIQMILPAVE